MKAYKSRTLQSEVTGGNHGASSVMKDNWRKRIMEKERTVVRIKVAQ